jgi:putative DNA methylase
MPVNVREALALINQTLDEVLTEQEGDFDADSRWALAWFEQAGFSEGDYGVAENSFEGQKHEYTRHGSGWHPCAKAGKVHLVRPDELKDNWNPRKDQRLTAWEMVHQLFRALEFDGESAAAALAAKLGSKAEPPVSCLSAIHTL